MISSERVKRLFTNLFQEKLHSSWLIAATCGGFLAGTGLAILPSTSLFASWFWPVLAVAILIFVFLSRLKIVVIFAVLAGLLLGLWRGTVERVDLNVYSEFLGQNVILRGTVNEDPDFGANGDLRLKLTDSEMIIESDYNNLQNEKDLDDYFTPMQGQIWVSVLARGADVRRSDVVEVSGKLKPGFGTFPASISFGSLNSTTRVADADPARDIRDAFGDKLRTVIPSPAADLGMGILAGQKTALPLALSAAFIAASLTHIVVASGYNLTILTRFARRLFAKISRFAALGFGGALVFAFACVTGFSPSMTRASLVAGFSLLAWYYGRKFHPVVLLLIVASITVFINPEAIWGDAGWYMSFLSFAGVIIMAPLIKSYFWGDHPEFSKKPSLRMRILAKLGSKKAKEKLSEPTEKLHTIRQILIETTSAQLMAAPIIALFMGNFSPYGLIANILVLPLLPLTMLLTFIAGIGAFMLPQFLAQIVAAPATWLLDYTIKVAQNVSDLPGASQQLQPDLLITGAIFLIILAAIFYMRFKTGHNLRDSNVVE